MKKLLLLLFAAALSLSASEPARAWGREGHETIAKIAERNLTKRAKKRIEKYLGGHSVVYYAKWMDEYRQTPEYAFTNDWHTAPVDADLRYGDELLKPGKGNAVYGLELAIRNLRDYRSLTDSAVAVNLKYVIHLVGDMHCPAHIKYTTHNTKYDVLFEDKYHKPHKYYVHHVWDNEIITTTRIWSVTEWADELDRASKREKAAVQTGTPRDWLHDSAKLNFDLDGGLHKLAEYSHDRELAYEGGGAGAAKVLREDVEASGAEVLLNTRASELITDETGAVVGVQAADEKTEYTINAKAVLLATGGYGNNKDLLNEEMKSALYYGPASSTGDGIVMATAENVKAATRLMEYGKRYPNGIEVSEGIAKSTIAGNIAAFSESAILINKEGQRVVNEKASNRTILETELKQTDGLLYLLMDASTFDIFKGKLATGGISEGDINNWLDNNGKTTPVFAHADSLAELAGIVGMDAETLENTVKTYNTFVQNGKDEEFGRAAEYLTKEIGEGPYYLVEQKPRFATTMGGLVVTTNLEVKNTSDTVIPGLYAAGETVGGVMGDDSPSGANNGWALTSGKLAAEAIAEALK